MPSGKTEMLHVAEDPDKAWAELGQYFFHEASTYSGWQPPGHTSSVHSHATLGRRAPGRGHLPGAHARRVRGPGPRARGRRPVSACIRWSAACRSTGMGEPAPLRREGAAPAGLSPPAAGPPARPARGPAARPPARPPRPRAGRPPAAAPAARRPAAPPPPARCAGRPPAGRRPRRPPAGPAPRWASGRRGTPGARHLLRLPEHVGEQLGGSGRGQAVEALADRGFVPDQGDVDRLGHALGRDHPVVRRHAGGAGHTGTESAAGTADVVGDADRQAHDDPGAGRPAASAAALILGTTWRARVATPVIQVTVPSVSRPARSSIRGPRAATTRPGGGVLSPRVIRAVRRRPATSAVRDDPSSGASASSSSVASSTTPA